MRAVDGPCPSSPPRPEFKLSLAFYELLDLGQPIDLSGPVVQSRVSGNRFPELSGQPTRTCERAVQTLKVYTGEVCAAMGGALAILCLPTHLFRVPGNSGTEDCLGREGREKGAGAAPCTREVRGSQPSKGQGPIDFFGMEACRRHGMFSKMHLRAVCPILFSILGGVHLWASEPGAPHSYA